MRPVAALLACLGAWLIAGAAGGQETAKAPSSGDARPLVLQVDIQGPIGPASAKHLADGLAAAADRDAAAVL
ncbi:MAG: nodulation protein NfeD, partial [Alphaproteobacteria bacterium]